MGFTHSLTAFVQAVSQKSKKVDGHDELWMKVRLRIVLENGDEWDPVLTALQGETLTAIVNDLAVVYKSLPFAKEYHDHVVAFSSEIEPLVKLHSAKLSNFIYTCGDAGLTFWVEAPASGMEIGTLSELIKETVLVSIRPATAVIIQEAIRKR